MLNDKIYRGFIRARTDEPKKGNEKFNRENVKQLPTWDDRKNCTNVLGVFEQPYGMLDFDVAEDWVIVKQLVKKLGLKLACKDGKNGNHVGGGHLYGKFPQYHFQKKIKNDNGVYNAIGLKVDIKSGWTNSVDSVKRGDTLLIDMDYNGDLEDLDEFPYWLIGDRRYIKLGTRNEGGRDETLNTRRGILAKIGYEHSQVLEVFNIINKYVFSKPLSQDEVNAKADKGRLEDDRNNTEFKLFGEYSFLDSKGKTVEEPRKMVDYLFNKYHVCNYNDIMYSYINDNYTDDVDLLITEISNEFDKLSYNKISEIVKLLNSKSKTNKKLENEIGYIKFKNGIVNLKTGELLGNTWEYFTTCTIPHLYNDTQSEWGEFFFNHVTNGDKDVIKLLFQIVGRCLYNRPIDSEAFIISGEGGNGKTTFLEMIEDALGKENTSPTDWSELGNGFATDDGRHSLAILADELSEDTFAKTGFFFKLSSGGTIMGNAKFGKRGKYRFNALLLSACNELPKLKNLELMIPLERRLTLIEFKKDLKKKENRIPNLKRERKKESFLEWLLYQGVKHFREVIETDKYCLPQDCINNMSKYKLEVDKITTWVQSLNEEDVIGFTSGDLTKRFRDWVDDESYAIPRGRISELIYKIMHIKPKLKNGNRVYTKVT